MKIIKKSFSILNWKLLLAIFATILIPAIYRISRVYFVGNIQDTYAFSIAGNLNWINIIFEVLEEAFLLPLFFALSKHLKNNDSNKNIIGQFYRIVLMYVLVITCCNIFAKQLSDVMSVQHVSDTVINFIRIEISSRFFVMFDKLVAIFLIAKNKWKELLIFLITKTTLNIILDTFIVSDNTLSLQKGILWVAWDQFIISFFMVVVGLIMIFKIYKFTFSDFTHPIMISKVNAWKQNLWSGAESFVRNGFFIWFVIKTINTLPGEFNQGDFWVMNNFIWNWLLIPVFAISQYLNKDQAFNSEKSLKLRLIAPTIIITGVILVWFSAIPAWSPFIEHVMKSGSYETVAHLVLVSIGFYVLYAYNDMIDKIFLGGGKAQWLLVQSLITDVCVYIPYYYLTTMNSLEDIVVMMGTAIAVDSILTFMMARYYFYKMGKRIDGPVFAE